MALYLYRQRGKSPCLKPSLLHLCHHKWEFVASVNIHIEDRLLLGIPLPLGGIDHASAAVILN